MNYEKICDRIDVMRKIITTTFVTLDGVMQAPGGPKEDTSNGFSFGGWQLAWDQNDKVADRIMREKIMVNQNDLLLGRVTYDIWVGYWPKHADEPIWGTSFDKATKYVVSSKRHELPWKNSKLITGNVETEIEKLKKSDGPDLFVWGSGNLIQTLLQHDLIDRMHIWTYPITIGSGKRLFENGTKPMKFKQTDSEITSTGVVFATYEPTSSLKKALR